MTSLPGGRVPPLVLLAAGEGTRLASPDRVVPKPCVPLLGQTLAERSLRTFQAAGILRAVVVVGWEAPLVAAHFHDLGAELGLAIESIVAPGWQRGNGVSALAARAGVDDEPFLLAMTDHLFTIDMVRAVAATTPRPGEVLLAYDRAIDAVFDLDDLTKLEVAADGRILAIGKELEAWNAGDTGLFHCTSGLFAGLEKAAADGRFGLSDGVRECIAEGSFFGIDVTGQEWLDVDTEAAYREAERRLGRA